MKMTPEFTAQMGPKTRCLNPGRRGIVHLVVAVGVLAFGLASQVTAQTLTYVSGGVTTAGSYTNPDSGPPNTVAPSASTDVVLNASSATYDLNNADLQLRSLAITANDGYVVTTGPTGSLETVQNLTLNSGASSNVIRFRGLATSAFQSLEVGGNLVLTQGILELGNRASSNQQRQIGNVTVAGSTQISSNSTLRLADAIGSIAFGSHTVNMILGHLNMSGGAFDIVSGSAVGNGLPDGGTNTIGVTQLSGSGTISGTKLGATLTTTGHLIVRGGESGTFSGIIQNGSANNVVALTKDGDSTQTLSGNNTYSGRTVVNAGTLLVNNTHIQSTAGVGGGNASDGLYRIGDGATLGGTGRIAGSGAAANTNMILLQSGATLAPGASIGTLTLDGANISGSGSSILKADSGAEFSFELAGDGSSADRISFWNYAGAGDLLLNDNVVNLTLSGAATNGTYTVTLFNFFSDGGTTVTASGISGGLTLTGASIDSNISSATLFFNTNTITLEYTVIPEPATAVLLTLSLCVVTFLRRRCHRPGSGKPNPRSRTPEP